MGASIRLATEQDARQLLEIYAPVVRETAISFELEPPSEEEFQRRIRSTLEHDPWVACEDNGRILGYAYAGKFRPRQAYQWTVETTVYVHEQHQRRGIALALYSALFECLRLQGYFSAVAVISLPNPASVALHERLGFNLVGVYPEVGYKHGKWYDVGWWQLTLQARVASPSPPVPVGTILDTQAGRNALTGASRFLTG